MQVSNINTAIIPNNGLSNITNHTTKSLIDHESIPWNGSVLKTTEATATLKFLDKLMKSVDQDINNSKGLKTSSKRHCRKATNTELSLCSISSASTDFKIKYCGNSDKKVWVGSINEDGCIKGKILSSCGNKESKECTYKVKEKEIACMKPFDLNERSNINDDFLQRSLGWSDNKNHDFSWSNKNSEWVSKNHKCNNK